MYRQIAIAAVLEVSLAAPAAATPTLTDLSTEPTTPVGTQSLETTAVPSSSLVDLEDTSTLDANNTGPADFADDVRVASDPTNATVSVDGTEVNVTTVTEANVTWYGFVAPSADNATVSVPAETDDETGMDDTDESEVAALNGTVPADETTPANASDEVLVETPFAANTSAILTVADGNATLNLTVTGDADNVTVYVANSTLVGDNETLEDVSASLDGTVTDTETVTDNGTIFYGFTVANASDPSVSLTLDVAVEDDGSVTVTYVTPLPGGVAPYDEADAVGSVNRVTPVEFSGKSRVGNASSASTSVTVRSDSGVNFTADVTVDEDPEDTTVYLRYDYAAGTAAPENVTVSVDNESVPFGVVRVVLAGENTTWIAFEVATATGAQVTVTPPPDTEAEVGAGFDFGEGDDGSPGGHSSAPRRRRRPT
jgi:hypothetical protein